MTDVGKWRSAGGVVIKDDKVLLVAPSGGFGGYSWTFPKGRLDDSEDDKDAAIREVAEEAGVKASIIDDLGVHEGTMSHTHYFLMKYVGESGMKDAEMSDVRFVSFDEAEELLDSNRDMTVLNLARKKMPKRTQVHEEHRYFKPASNDVRAALRRLGGHATETALLHEADVSHIDLEIALQALSDIRMIKRSRITEEVRFINEADDDDDDKKDADKDDAGDDSADAALDDIGQTNSDQQSKEKEGGDSLDAQVDKYFIDYEKEAKTQKTESRHRYRTLKSLMTEANDDAITAAGGTSSNPGASQDFDVEKFATNVARLIENYDNVIEFKDTLLKRAINFLNKGYDDQVIDGFKSIMKEQYSLVSGKSQFDIEDDFEAPRAANAGPGGDGAV